MCPVLVMGTVYLPIIRQVVRRIYTAVLMEMVDTKEVRQTFEVARDYELMA